MLRIWIGVDNQLAVAAGNDLAHRAFQQRATYAFTHVSGKHPEVFEFRDDRLETQLRKTNSMPFKLCKVGRFLHHRIS